jgi:hypothetical protein
MGNDHHGVEEAASERLDLHINRDFEILHAAGEIPDLDSILANEGVKKGESKK